jgi:hypothetical protein
MCPGGGDGSAQVATGAFIAGCLVGSFFGLRLNIRILQYFYWRDRQSRQREADPLTDWLSRIRLKETLVLDVIGTGAGFSTLLIATRFF